MKNSTNENQRIPAAEQNVRTFSKTSGLDKLGSALDESDIKVVVPPDGGWGWVVVAASFMCNFIVDGIIFSGGMLSKPIQEEFHASDRQVAPVNSLLAGFYLLAGPFASALANKYGFRMVTIIGSFMSSIAFIISYFATSVEYLYFSYAIGGLGYCMIFMPSVVIVGFYFERWRALAIGLALCGSGVGTFIIVPLTDKLIERFGWRITIVIHGGLSLLCLICGVMFRPLKSVHIQVNNKSNNITKDKLFNNNSASSVPLSRDNRLIKSDIPRNHSDDVLARYTITGEIVRDKDLPINRRTSVYSNNMENLVNDTVISTPLTKDVRSSSKNNVDCTELLIRPLMNPLVQTRLHQSHADVVNHYLNRDDIFYGGSLKRLPQYISCTSLGYHLAVTHNSKIDVREKSPKGIGYPESVRKTLGTMLDFSLFRSPTFIMLATSGFFTMAGLFVPYMFVKQRAEDNGVGKTNSVLLVSTIGVANIIGRALSGLVSSVPNVSALLLNNIALTMGGVASILSGLCYKDVYQFVYCIVFGLAIACFASLRSILVVEYIGLQKLTDCYGLLLLFQGFGALLGSPIAGALIDFTGGYDLAFYVSGAFILLSAVLCYPIGYISKWEKTRCEPHLKSEIALS